MSHSLPTSMAPGQALAVPQPPFRAQQLDGHTRPSPDTEWLLTLGNGGFAMGTASGVNRRKYHALLIASLNPPVERFSVLSGVDEHVALFQGGRQTHLVSLGARRFVGGRVEPEGWRRLRSFEKTATVARWTYDLGPAELVKELRVGWRRNVCAMRYTVRSPGHDVRLWLVPRVTMRDFHGTIADLRDAASATVQAGERELRVSRAERTLRLSSDAARAVASPSVLPFIHLDFETERHQEDTEHLFLPGWFEASWDAGPEARTLVLAAGLDHDAPDLALFEDHARERHLDSVRARFVAGHPQRAALAPLVDAADDFLVQRRVDGRVLATIIAGYPWFADWGRDTMISLNGLMIATGRLDEARSCLETFARHVSQGMIPNRFDDYGGEPEYNTVDASLWFLHACAQYLDASGDRATFDGLLKPACLQIIEHYQRGTRFGIHADPADGLIMAGDAGTQLTWMDAKRNGVVFTPRHGKPVEISALWHHGLLCIAGALERGGSQDASRARELRATAARVGESFRAQFWHAGERRLHDCLQQEASGAWRPVPELRPNQIFAASLEHAPLSLEQRRGVVSSVRTHLLTPVGLRTLAPHDPNYCPRFDGDMMTRDRAYHNGTVWPWLIGAYAEAVLRAGAFSADAKAEVRAALQPLLATLAQGCLGQIAEVYDAEDLPGKPRREQACIAQAWSVAETLRAALLAL